MSAEKGTAMEKRYAARGSFSAEHLPVGTKSSNLAAEIKTTDAMPRLIFILFSLLVSISSTAQEQADSLFRVHLENDEYQVWMDLNLYDNDIVVPGQDILGALPGYLGARRDPRKWLVLESVIEGKTATLTIVNDYGSEDLQASLVPNGDGTYMLTRLSGSTIKIVVDRKWVKLPKKLVFKRK